MANHGSSPWGGQGYVNVHKPTASCLTQIRESLSTGGGRRGLDSSDERKGSGEPDSDKTKGKKKKRKSAEEQRKLTKDAAFSGIPPVASYDFHVNF